jgi:hypothetical protein
MYYIYVNLHIDFKLSKKIIKFKIITLLHSFDDYIILTIKKYLNICKKYDREIINKFNYILSNQRLVVAHNVTHYLTYP